ncbi:hypothetical protein [Flavobacterium algoritolerans]|uniref:Uncharacterized protein n=1 Tax=Flavobacterium algoritolerans TaxID=3041254 RepID=A0ABT6V857_9FLAO|nr:hypothetical protein [Flavobacterium algoritolerans]MDI5894377.1 hypothetical protein [Flavobacterium algoritolerans]
MSKTMQINPPQGFKFQSVDQSSGAINLVEIPKDIKERITNLNDVIRENGKTEEEFRESCKGLEPDEVAYKMIKEIVKAFNEGWVPDWTNSNEGKYYPWFKMGSPSGGSVSYGDCDRWYTGSCVGSRLCFKSADLAKHAGQLFESIYKDFLTV